MTDCRYRLLRGGITDFLIQAQEPAAAIDALVTIGMLDVARVLRRGLELLEAVPAEKGIRERLDLVGRETLDDLESQLGAPSEIGHTLRVWIARHRSAFAVD